jgi:hypothetical protein
VPADVDGELGIAFAVVFVVPGTEDRLQYNRTPDILFTVYRGGLMIYQGQRRYSELDPNHVVMHFLVPGSFKHKGNNVHLRVQFHCQDASKSKFLKSFGYHLIRRYEEKKTDLIDDNQVTKRPSVDDGNLESDCYQHQKGILQLWEVDFQMQRICDLVNRNYTNNLVIIM